MLSGCAIAARALSPGCRVVGVEPAAGDDATRSFRTKELQAVDNPRTVADGARTPSLGSLTFPLVLEYVSDMTTIDDPTLLQTMFFLWERMKLVVEPTGAETQVYTKIAGVEVTSVFRERHDFKPGETIRLKPDAARAHLFDAASGMRLAA